MRPRLWPVLPLLLSALPLTACGTKPLPTVTLPVPATLLQCSPEPAAPADPMTDAGLAGFIVDLADAGQDCRGKLQAVKGLQ